MNTDVSTECLNIASFQKESDKIEERCQQFIPVDYAICGARIFIHYIRAPKSKPIDAFISYTERRQKKQKEKSILVQLDDCFPAGSNALAGFLFHSARCGSTLLCNTLDTYNDCFVVRESGVVNKLLNDPCLSSEQKKQLLHVIVNSYCEYAQSLGTKCVIKFSSHCVFHLPFLLAEFPSVPWIYLFRDPRAVLYSLLKSQPKWLSAGFVGSLKGLKLDTVPDSPELLAALILNNGFRHILENHKVDDGSLLISYEKLVNEKFAVCTSAANLFGFNINKTKREDIENCFLIDSKSGKPLNKASTELDKKMGLAPKWEDEIEQVYQDFCWRNYDALCRQAR